MSIEFAGLPLCSRCRHSDDVGCVTLHQELCELVERLNRNEVVIGVRMPNVRLVVESPCRDVLRWSTDI